jgi:hypothetical protein
MTPSGQSLLALRQRSLSAWSQLLGHFRAALREQGFSRRASYRLCSAWFAEDARRPRDEPLRREIDLGSGAFSVSPELAQSLQGEQHERTTKEPEPPDGDSPGASLVAGTSFYRFSAEANAEWFFQVLSAIQSLSDGASRLIARLEIGAESDTPVDRSWLRNAVEECLEEAGRQWRHDTWINSDTASGRPRDVTRTSRSVAVDPAPGSCGFSRWLCT